MPTLLAMLALCALVLGVCTHVVATRTQDAPGLRTWAWALIVNALSYPAFTLRLMGWPALSIVLSNLLTSLSLALFALALVRFHREPLSPWLRQALWLPVALAVLFAVLLVDHHFERNVLVALLQIGFAVLQAWLARHRAPHHRLLSGHTLILFGALGLALLFAWRVLMMLTNTDWPAPLFVPPAVQLATYLGVFVALIANTLGFILMHMECATEREHELATHDALTGLLNRREMLSQLTSMMAQAQRKGRPLAALMVDIDHFKRVNDTYGHVNGDVVLREVAKRMKRRLRRYDVLARFGGEEFLMLLPETGEAEAVGVAESLRQAVAASPIVLPDRVEAPSVTVSVGVHARLPRGEPDEATRIISACDAALYQAKSAGRNRVAVQP